jgi:hemoglobin
MINRRLQGLCFVLGLAFLLGGSVASRADSTLYEDLGGKEGLTKIVQYSVDNYMADPRIRDDLDNINLDRLRSRFFDQFCELTGGPCKYTGRDMAATHKGLHLTVAKFNAVVEDLQDAMDKVGISSRTQNRFLALLAPMKSAVVTQ